MGEFPEVGVDLKGAAGVEILEDFLATGVDARGGDL
jgi:hypothetical protein